MTRDTAGAVLLFVGPHRRFDPYLTFRNRREREPRDLSRANFTATAAELLFRRAFFFLVELSALSRSGDSTRISMDFESEDRCSSVTSDSGVPTFIG